MPRMCFDVFTAVGILELFCDVILRSRRFSFEEDFSRAFCSQDDVIGDVGLLLSAVLYPLVFDDVSMAIIRISSSTNAKSFMTSE